MLADLMGHGLPAPHAGRHLGMEGGVEQRPPLVFRQPVRQGKDIPQLHGHVGAVGLIFAQGQPLAKRREERFADGAAVLQSHGVQPPPLAQYLAHLPPEIVVKVECLVLGVDVGVAGNAECRGLLHRVRGKNVGEPGEQDLLCGDAAHITAGQEHHIRRRSRHRNQCQDFLSLAPQAGTHVNDLVLQMGEGMMGVDDLG